MQMHMPGNADSVRYWSGVIKSNPLTPAVYHFH